ncbi:MAG: AsmA family protein [Sphingobacteriales bacterium JAD_PAG50586_3]|nr:MAG: AsmA family protein [Sphingobacteriales bacterium JAD_PAG50586_3]
MHKLNLIPSFNVKRLITPQPLVIFYPTVSEICRYVNMAAAAQVAYTLFLFSSLPFVIIYLAASIIFIFFKDDVKSYLVEKLNDELVTEVKIEDIEFSVLKKFPYASVELKNVSADEITPNPVKEKLFTAGRIYCLFNWYEMFSSNFHLRKVEFEDLTLNFKRFDDGSDNFHFWKEQKSTGEPAKFSLNLHKVKFKNVEFKYVDKRNKTFLGLNLLEGMVSGSFADEQYTLTAKAALTADVLTFGGITIPPTPDVRISFIADANNKTKTYNFQNAQLFLGKLSLLSNGQIIAGKDPSLNLNIKGDKLDVASVLSALPREYASFADDYASKGLFYLDGNIAGPLGKPIAKANFGISSGNITHKPSGTVMSNVNLSGSFNSGEVLQKGELVVSRISLQLKQGSLRGRFKLVNLINPYISASVQGTADLGDIKNFIPGTEIKHMAGSLIVDAEIKGPLGDVEALADGNTNAVASGHVEVRNGSVELSSFAHRIAKVNARASFGNDIVDLDQCAFNIGKSNFNLNGRVLSFPSCILNSKQKIHIDASLGSSYCDIGELIKKPIENPLKDTASVFQLSERLESELTIRADKITFNKFGALNMVGNLKLYNRVIDLSGVSLQTAGVV